MPTEPFKFPQRKVRSMTSFEQSFYASPYQSIKHQSYFDTYDTLFAPYRQKEIVFVEIGVQGGGSLHAWKDYFGENARIIGIDLNPTVSVLKNDGFEIFIGDQSDGEFWKHVFEKIGKADIVLDDGGHTYEQQINTVEACIPNIKDGGLIVVEDTHTSYLSGFGPRSRSLVAYTKTKFDKINLRDKTVSELYPKKKAERRILSIRLFESIIAFEINPSKAVVQSSTVSNGKPPVSTEDLRHSKQVALNFLETFGMKHARRLNSLPKPFATVSIWCFRMAKSYSFRSAQ